MPARAARLTSLAEATVDGRQHVVAEAANGLEALDAVDRYHPDVTLRDLRMPILEGVETVRRLRERDPNARSSAFNARSSLF
jgi:YesN/AraC family two-component response regulator